jgi:hypothetical protein
LRAGVFFEHLADAHKRARTGLTVDLLAVLSQVASSYRFI